MRLQSVWACAGSFAIAALVGCTGSIGQAPSGSGGSGAGSGTGNTTGSAGNGSGVGNTGGSGTPGTAGTNGGVAGELDLTGSPKYFRVVRLSNTQWARAIQTALNVTSGGMEENFESPVSGM